MFTSITGALMRRARYIVLACALASGLAALATHAGAPLEAGVDRIRQAVLSKRASGDVVVVAIDQESIDRLQAWPWPRSTHGRLIDRLRGYGARAVLMDVDFSTDAADPEQDRLLAAALTRAPGLVGLIGSADEVDGRRTTNQPNDALRPHARVLGSWISVDDQRRVTLPRREEIHGVERDTIATVAARSTSARRDEIAPDWSIRIDTIPTISYADVLDGRVPVSALRGRTVLVGATASMMGDRWEVPGGERVPGVLIHALGAETLKRGEMAHSGGLPELMAACLLVFLAAGARSRLVSGLATAVSGAAIVGLAWLVREHAGVTIDVAPVLIALTAALLAHAAAAVATVVMRHLTTDATTDLPNMTAMRIDSPVGTATVAVRLRNHLDTATALGADLQAELMRRVRDRIRLAAGESATYQVDEHSFAWRTAATGSDLTDTLEGLAALFAGGIHVAGRTVDAPVTGGICEGSGDIQHSVTAALLAADHAARQGLTWTRHQDADADAQWRVSMMSELGRALDGEEEAGRVWVAYQPKHDLRSGRIASAEALVRWTHPERGPIRPDHFIPALEEAGQIERLTMVVLDTAIRDFAALPGTGVAVNLSTRLLGLGRLVEPVGDMLRLHGMPPERLTLEITESAVLTGERAIAELDALRAMGVKLSIDDYGTGQSTLSYLKRLPANELKVDQSFVRAVLTSRSDQVMIASTINLAHELGLVVVAEGVETADVLEALRGLDCDVIQGYHIGKPMPFEEFVSSVARDVLSPSRAAA